MTVLCCNNDVVDEMRVLGERVHSRRLVPSWKAERGVGDGQAMGVECLKQEETVIVAFPYSVGSDDSLPWLVVLTYTSVEVAKK